MPDSNKRSQEFKDFRFRRRYDHLLHFKLLNAKPSEIIEAAKELGFKINAKDLAKTNSKKTDPIRKKSTIERLQSFFKG